MTSSRGNVAVILALVGVSWIVGGEALCILGPLRYQPALDRVCHGFFYAGAGLVGIAAIVHWRADRRRS